MKKIPNSLKAYLAMFWLGIQVRPGGPNLDLCKGYFHNVRFLSSELKFS